MRRSTASGNRSRFADYDGEVGLGRSLGDYVKKYAGVLVGAPIAIPALSTAAAVAAPAVAITTAAAPLIPTIAGAAWIAPDAVKELGEKWNIGDHSDDWKKWGKGIVDVATLGVSRNKSVRDAVKELGEQWNVGNNSVDTLKSIANVASIVGAISGVGTLASAMLGSSSLTQGAITVAREYARQSLKTKVIGKAGEELADPYVDHLIRKARRDAQALAAEEAALVAQYKEQRPGVYSLMMMAVENPNALDQEQMQVIVNYQRDLERERAVAAGMPPPPNEDWANYYTRFLAEYGVSWQPLEHPGVDLVEGGGLPPPALNSKDALYRLMGKETDAEQNVRLARAASKSVIDSPRVPQSLAFSPELKAALDSLYPPSKTA